MTTNHFDVFLSYHWRDRDQVERLARSLRDLGIKPYLDRWYLVPGRPWPQALEEVLASCHAVAVCVGPGEMGPWQQREQYLALERQVAAERRGQRFSVIPVLLPGAESPLGLLGQLTWIDLRKGVDNPVMLQTLVNAIHGKPPGPDAQETVREILASICPYRGLLYFREEDAPFFFGREAAINQIVSAVQQHNLVAVVGASGSGMSSVVRAGLVPELRKARDRVWEVTTIVPTDRPVHALAAVLTPFLEPDMRETDRLIEMNKLAEALLSHTVKLREVVDRVLAKQPGTDRLLLITDQWEELFTLCQDDVVRRCFIDNILEATATTKLSVVLTLRGDFFGRAISEYRPLSDRVQGAQINLGPMNQEELRLAIEEPARQVGLTFEPGLVDRILAQVGNEPGHLPLVEFVLRRLWDDQQGGYLHHEAYKAMGELHGAIAQKAESIYGGLSPHDQQGVQQIFFRLVHQGEGEGDTRRRATFDEIGNELRCLVKMLADERLLVTSQLAGSVEETVEVSHEALIRHWGQLKKWLNDDREYLAWQRRVNPKTREWERYQHNSDLLLRGQPLTEALMWLKKKPGYISPAERRFVMASNSRAVWKRGRIAFYYIVALLLIRFLFNIELSAYSFHQAGLKVQSFVCDHFGSCSIHLKPEMQPMAAGSFWQGEKGKTGEQPVRKVTVKAFAIGKFEVTFEEYDRFAIAKERPLPPDQGWGRGRHPVINVSQDDAEAYAKWLSEQTGKRYRLPTESEWEYAARSGVEDNLWTETSDDEGLKRYAVYSANSGSGTKPVGHDQGRKSSAIGLYDMMGNVWEWVQDCWHDDYHGAPEDGSAWRDPEERCVAPVRRGGSWFNKSMDLRVSNRARNTAGSRSDAGGFRLAQDIEP